MLSSQPNVSSECQIIKSIGSLVWKRKVCLKVLLENREWLCWR